MGWVLFNIKPKSRQRGVWYPEPVSDKHVSYRKMTKQDREYQEALLSAMRNSKKFVICAMHYAAFTRMMWYGIVPRTKAFWQLPREYVIERYGKYGAVQLQGFISRINRRHRMGGGGREAR